MKFHRPIMGERRVKKTFPLIPCQIDHEVRWFETTYILQRNDSPTGDPFWENVAFVDKIFYLNFKNNRELVKKAIRNFYIFILADNLSYDRAVRYAIQEFEIDIRRGIIEREYLLQAIKESCVDHPAFDIEE